MQPLFLSRAFPRVARIATRQRPTPHNIQVQPVRFSRPRRRIIPTLLGVAVGFVCVQTYLAVVFSPLGDFLERQYDGLSPAEKAAYDKEVEEAANSWSLFLPFPTSTEKTHPPEYKAWDPEMREYKRIYASPEAQMHIQSRLADMARRLYQFALIRRGESDANIQVRQFKFVLGYPTHPPPEHRQSGILIDKDGWRVTKRPVSERTANALRKVMWPASMAHAFWIFSRAYILEDFQAIRKLLHLEGISGETETARTSSPTVENRTSQENGRKATDTQSMGGISSTETDKAGPLPTAWHYILHSAQQSSDSIRTRAKRPWDEAIFALRQHWLRDRPHPPRGCVRVSGWVQLISPTEIIALTASGWWDPKAQAFDNPTLSIEFQRRSPLPKSS